MKLLVLACITAVAALAVPALGEESTSNWKYGEDDHGRVGVANWKKAYPTCGGKRQSPIDISVDIESRGDVPLHFSGSCGHYNVTQKYDAFKAQVQGGSCAVNYFGKNFRFAQVHFHSPSEHTIDGKAFDGEAHFVHQATDGKIVVVGVFLQRGDKKDKTPTDPFFAEFFETLDDVEDDAPVTAKLGSFHTGVKKLFEAGRVFNYPGGLTVPPCSEVVNWWVLETPLTISSDDYDAISDNLQRIEAAVKGKNARPTQKLHGRKIKVY